METSGRIWPNVKLIQALMFVIITCKHEKDLIKNSGENRRHCFSHYRPMGIFFRRSRAANSAVSGPIRPKFEHVRALMHVIVTSGLIWPNFKLIQALMYVIITWKYEKDPIEKKWRHPFSQYGDFFRRSRAANSAVSGPSRPKFELVPALMHVIIACEYENDQMKNSREKVETLFSPL